MKYKIQIIHEDDWEDLTKTVTSKDMIIETLQSYIADRHGDCVLINGE
tara:strand:- start:1053 stop:1196 length:144 start_codon:yes stop_codon:yes gene_type:complete